jgi:hypothetical protein
MLPPYSTRNAALLAVVATIAAWVGWALQSHCGINHDPAVIGGLVSFHMGVLAIRHLDR